MDKVGDEKKSGKSVSSARFDYLSPGSATSPVLKAKFQGWASLLVDAFPASPTTRPTLRTSGGKERKAS
jgi:hypothetical protein